MMRRQQRLKMGIALTFTMLFLIGCGNTPSTPTPEDSVATSTPEIENEEPAVDGPRVGDVAPDFTLPDSTGNIVHFADELQENQVVVLVFYHHHT
jgi:cytochrome oxidase Cu insertion factor (SCO1/SenC/PrrC family)